MTGGSFSPSSLALEAAPADTSACSPCRFNVWAVVFVVTRLFTLTLYILVIGFGLPRVENQALDPERGNFFSFLFNNILFR